MSRRFSALLVGPTVLAALVGCNSAPIAPVVAIQPDDPTTIDDFELRFLSRSTDPDLADTVEYTIFWYRDGEEMAELQDTLDVSADLTAKNQEWTVEVVPVDSQGMVGQAARASITVQNLAPTATVEIVPAKPGSYEDLVARPTGEDLDGDGVTYRYTWLLDGEVVEGLETNTVPAEETTKGDVWTVRVTPFDGQDEGEPAEARASIGNALPIAEEVVIDPAVAREDTVLRALPTGSDEDGDAIIWSFTWYVNDIALPGADGDTLDGDSFDKGDRVVVEATPNDGLADGDPVRSAPVRVRNTRPTLTGAEINPGEAYEASSLTCIGSGFEDLDGDPEGYRTTWVVDGARYESEILDGTRFDKGATVTCELEPYDGSEAGDLVVSAPITILNTPPVLSRVTITNTAPKEGDVLEARVEGVGDDDGDTVEFRYSWTVDGTEVATTETLSSDLFSKGNDIQVTVTPFDGTDEGVSVTSPIVTVVNTPPELDGLTLGPSEVRTLDTLTATATATDADGDTVTFDYAWYVDGSKITATGATLDGTSFFDKNEDVYVVVTPNDGDDDGTSLTSDTITVLNTVPELSSAAISPSTVVEATTATCVPSGWTDDDEDPESYTYAWYVNGSKVGVSSTLDGDFFDRGDTLYCEVTPNDGEEDGDTVTSATVTISNTAPTIDTVELSTTSPAEGDTVYAVIVDAEDVDGDSITYSYAWYVDGAFVSSADEIDSTQFDKGDSIYVIVTPSDDVDTGTGVKSNVGTVANTAPVISSVSLAPTSPRTTQGVTATVISTDADGDSITYSYAWYVEGVKVASTGATLATSDFTKNEDIYVVVTPDDGDDTGTSYTSSTITSINTAPSITGVSIVPGTGVTETSTLTCTPTGWNDDDGDTEGYAWQWKVDGRLVAVTRTLTGTFFGKGDSITCTATPNDGEDLGTAMTSSAVSVDNTAPTLASVTLSETSPQEGDTISATLGSASDADGDRISFNYAWKVNGSTVSTATTLSGTSFDKGDTIELVVTPTDGTDDGTPVSSGTITAANTAPVISSVTLAPTSPKTTDTISATVVASDADGDSLTYTYTWTVDGSTVSGVTGSTLAGSYFDKEDVISVSVVPDDGDDTGSAVSSSAVTAVNTPPVLASASLSPTRFGESDTVTCVPSGWSDADGDAAGYAYAWKVNGSVIGASTSTLGGSSFSKGDTVQCIVTPNDGDDDGTPVSTAVAKVDNSAPELASATITPTSPKEGSTLSVTLGSYSDADGDTVSFTYAWMVGGSTVGTGATLTGTAFDKGDVITVEVTPTDGTDDGTPVTSSSVTVDNTAPVVSGVTLAPSSVGTDGTLTATVAASDVDGDSLTYAYTWRVNGSAVSATGATLDGSVHFAKGDTVTVTVTADDGDDTSTAVTSAAVTVGNTPPSITSASVSPGTVREATTATCTPSGWSDADGDSPGYRYQWLVNGAPSGTSATLTGASFKKGDSVGCKVTPFDGTDTGIAVSSSTVKVLNTAPVLSSVALSDTSPAEGDTLSAVLGSATDADGDSVTYTYAWRVNGSVVASSSTLSSTYFGRGDTITVTVTPTDGDDDGTPVTSGTATVVNTAPVVSSVTLAPASPKTNDVLRATVTASDADGDSLTTTYEWKVNGVTVSGATGSTLSGVSHFDKTEDVTVTATVSDGTLTGSATSASVEVANTPPALTGATISATTVQEGDSLSCSPVGWSDADGDTAGYKYAWLADGTVISGATTSTLTSADFAKGEKIRCSITPWDGDDDGTAVLTPEAEVLNTKPVTSGVSLSNLSPRTNQSVTATVTGASDVDGDTVRIRYQWYVGGALHRTTTTTSMTNTLAASEFVKNEEIYVVITPYDGDEYGTSRTSTKGRSVNTVPAVSSLTLSPSTVRTGNSITAATSASDIDGDSLSYSYTWYHQNEGSGGFSAIGGSGSTLSSSLFDKADRVYAVVSVNDGEDTTTFTSSTITVANTAPGAPSSISMSPSSPLDTQDITCSVSGGSDVDGDSLTYRFWWYRNGSYYTTTSTTSGSSTIAASATTAGQTWRCEAARFDGTDYSSRTTASVTVRASWKGLRRFTNCGSEYHTGPSQSNCNSAYTSTALAGEVTVSGGLQSWTVPSSGTYRIWACGGAGRSADNRYYGGRGACVRGDFSLTSGQQLLIGVGQRGTVRNSSGGTSPNNTGNGGGGGGTFVVRKTQTSQWSTSNSLLLAAGGGGGTRASVRQNGCDGETGYDAGTGSGSRDTWGCGTLSTSYRGKGGPTPSSSWGSSGGGWTSDGAPDPCCGGVGGKGYGNRLVGGKGTSLGSEGGFGAGGSGDGSWGGGGGGGYSGGQGGRLAGGGGSYPNGSNRSTSLTGYNAHGYVTIDKL